MKTVLSAFVVLLAVVVFIFLLNLLAAWAQSSRVDAMIIFFVVLSAIWGLIYGFWFGDNE